MNSPLYNVFENYYKKGLYTEEQLQVFIAAGKLREEEYKQIIEGNQEG